ncbi:MAG: alpha/beta fold hydrolase [Chloroflexota bacterium]
MIELEKLLRVPYVDPNNGFDISPGGDRIAFSWNQTGQWELYELPLSASDIIPEGDSAEPVPVPLTPCPSPKGRGVGVRGAKFAPKYSPEGARLAYAVDFDGGENFHLFVHDFDTGADTDLTQKREIHFALQPNFCWSPDGRQIAFVSNQGGNFDAYIMPSAGGAAKCVLSIQRPVWDVHWSPDGEWLAVTFESRGQDYGVYFVPLNGGEAFPLADGNGPLNAHNPAWSPNSQKLAFHSDAPNGWHQIGIFDLPSREIAWLTDEPADCRTPSWSPGGSHLAYIRAQGGTDQVMIHTLGGKTAAYQVEAGVHYKPHFTPGGEHVIFIFNNPRFPPDLWKLSLASGELDQLTYSLPDEMDDEPYVVPQEITYPGADGAPIPALLFALENAGQTSPAILVIHGGPNWHYQVEWYPFMIHLASRGWTVLAPNYRGSTGYGRDWQTANRFDLGGVDTDDVAAGARFLVREKLADPARIAVSGRSHGGYLTMTCLTQYPELWAVGSAIVPFMNWFLCHERSRDDLKHWDIEMMGDPNHNHDLWYERSPYFFLDRIRVPVQLICGEHDPRCPAEDSIETRDKLLELGKEVDFHLYEGEGHGFLKIENVLDSEGRRVEFLAQILENSPQIPKGDAVNTNEKDG